MEHKVLYENTEVSYSLSGKGPVVVWLHGFMEDKSIWGGQLSTFDNFTTNICIDLLGHGETGDVLGSDIYTMELQSKLVLAVLSQLGIDVFSIIGHSMGGYVGLFLLEICPEKILHFVLLNSTSSADTEEKKLNRARAIKIVAQQKKSYARLGVVNLFSKESRDLYSTEIENLVQIAQETSVQGIIGSLLGMMNRMPKEKVLKNYKGKKMIIAGKSDPVLSIKNSGNEANFVGAKFKYLLGGHMSYLESKNQLNATLLSFIGSD